MDRTGPELAAAQRVTRVHGGSGVPLYAAGDETHHVVLHFFFGGNAIGSFNQLTLGLLFHCAVLLHSAGVLQHGHAQSHGDALGKQGTVWSFQHCEFLLSSFPQLAQIPQDDTG